MSTDRNADANDGQAPRAVSRRAALKVLGTVAGASAVGAVPAVGQPPVHGHQTPNAPAQPAKPAASAPRAKFLTARELRTVAVLADDVLPRDERSGSATDAGVPAFIDYHLAREETSAAARLQFRGGLRWLDTESRARFGVAYAAAREAQRHAILDDIAYPDKVDPRLRHGAAFFGRFRDMCASGFFSSAVGWKDLQYMGHTFVPVWDGCPKPALDKLGVSYDLMTSRTTQK
jgi:hypothetical protein